MTDQILSVESSNGASDQRILRCSGPLTLATLFTLRDTIRTESSPKVIVDLTHVPYIDSAGLGALIQAHISLKREGRALALTGVNDKARALMDMTNVSQVFAIYSTADEVR